MIDEEMFHSMVSFQLYQMYYILIECQNIFVII